MNASLHRWNPRHDICEGIMVVAHEGLKAAIAAAGGPKQLGRHLGITGQAISQWKKIPAERVVEVEHATGVKREFLRPDLYRPQRSSNNGSTRKRSAKIPSQRIPSPTFVATFVNGNETIATRMTTYTPKGLDLARGVRLSRFAFEQRKRTPAPAITAAHFERDGKIIETYTREQLENVP